METFTTKVFVNDANSLCKELEKYAYGWTHYIPTPTELRKVEHKAHINEDNDDAVECINQALDIICQQENDIAEITLPIEMRGCKINLLQYNRGDEENE